MVVVSPLGIPTSDVPFIYFADGTHLTKFKFSNLQMMPHAEQIVARLAHGGDMAAVVILATTPEALQSANHFREIAADSFPVQVYSDVDKALDRLNELLKQVPQQRRVPTRELA